MYTNQDLEKFGAPEVQKPFSAAVSRVKRAFTPALPPDTSTPGPGDTRTALVSQPSTYDTPRIVPGTGAKDFGYTSHTKWPLYRNFADDKATAEAATGTAVPLLPSHSTYWGPFPEPEIGPVTPDAPAKPKTSAPDKWAGVNRWEVMPGQDTPLSDRTTTVPTYNQKGEYTGNQVLPYQEGLAADMQRRGPGDFDVPASPESGYARGNVSQMVMPAEQLKEVQARKDAVLPALDSYNQALDQRNYLESAHGPEQYAARQAKLAAFAKKYGLNENDLKRMELNAKIPMLQAEAAAHLANADKLKAEAGNISTGGKNKSYLGASLQKAHETLTQRLYDPTTDPTELPKLRESLGQIEQDLEKYDKGGAQNSGETKGKVSIVPPKKPTLDEFKAAVRAKGSKLSDTELQQYYSENYGG